MPQRIQKSRAKGWRMPEGAVYVGRPTKWGNPYRVGTVMIPNAEAATMAFAANLPIGKIKGIEELRGKDLACWCPLDQPCHADVLLREANSEDDFIEAALAHLTPGEIDND